MKKYKIGFYGGKFMPFHKGHLYCTQTMSEECETGFLILFAGGEQEEEILKNNSDVLLNPNMRWNNICAVAKSFPNVIPVFIDVSKIRLEDGSEDWDGETPLVRKYCGNKIDAVYSSELAYDAYFKRAYPEAEHRLIDPLRSKYPISATKIRNMTNTKEKEVWTV